MIKAALFDLDGVVLDTETQYSKFWENITEELQLGIPDLANKIKGTTLTNFFSLYYPNDAATQKILTERIDQYELDMEYNYIPGFETFINELRAKGIKCAVVTSSNQNKMRAVYVKCPELKGYFDLILTSEDFIASKPHPDCYLKGAAGFGLSPEECVGFEDSFNGLKAVRAAGEFVVGLATTNTREAITPYSDLIIDNYEGFGFEQLSEAFYSYLK